MQYPGDFNSPVYITGGTLPLPTGAATAAGQATLDTDLQTVNVNLGIINANLTNGNNLVQQDVSNLGVTVTATAGSAVTATLPAVSGKFHYITLINIVAYTTAARTGSATPILVTSTNLATSYTWNFQTAGAIGTSENQNVSPVSTIKSSVANTATTIVCPATANVIWRVNIFYYAAA